MKDKCELDGTSLTEKNIHILVLIDDTHGEVLNEMTVCNDCKENFEFTIGAIEWEDN